MRRKDVDYPEKLAGVSLCSGGGGLDIGLQLAIPGYESVLYCEREAFAAAYLVAQMEAGVLAPAPVWTDLKTFRGERLRGKVDILSGGYPCQPFSHAGKRGGRADPRHLWPHFHRLIGEIEPPIVFVENVSGHLSLGFDEVSGSLEGLGYRVAAGLFTAGDLGAPHERERVFTLAISDAGRKGYSRDQRERSSEQRNGKAAPRSASQLRRVRVEEEVGDSNRRALQGRRGAEQQGEAGSAAGRAQVGAIDVGHPNIGRRHRVHERIEKRHVEADVGGASAGIPCPTQAIPTYYPPGPDDDWSGILERWPHLAPAILAYGDGDGCTGIPESDQREAGRKQAPRRNDLERRGKGGGGSQGQAESAFRKLADVLAADRNDYLRMLGNGVVPIQAAFAFLTLWASFWD